MQQNLKLASFAVFAYKADMKWVAIIVAAGTSERASLPCPKQYHKLQFENQYEPILTQSVRQILPFVEAVQVVIHKDHEALYTEALHNLPDEKILPVVYGGASRQESVRLGLESLPPSEFVMIHDAARPFVSHALIQSLQSAVEKNGACVPSLPSADSACFNEAGKITEYLNRAELSLIQTPQGFKTAEILQAHRDSTDESFNDDASLAIARGISVAVIEGDANNKKLTHSNDFTHAHPYRSATGFDVHAFCDGDHIKLCGVKIPHSKSLEGHSDADVGLHAVCDAMLAVARQADIGVHFSPMDDKWKDADSRDFIKFANKKLREENLQVSFVDVTIICEEPKIAPHREALIQNLEKLLGIQNAVAVKATTTEKLGALGNGDGIAVMATLTAKVGA